MGIPRSILGLFASPPKKDISPDDGGPFCDFKKNGKCKFSGKIGAPDCSKHVNLRIKKALKKSEIEGTNEALNTVIEGGKSHGYY